VGKDLREIGADVPPLTDLPIGLWMSAAVLDLMPGTRRASQVLVAAGLAGAVPTVLTGIAVWSALHREQQRVGLVHAAGTATASLLYSASFVARYQGRMLNLHPSLLPKYPGLDTHRRVLEAGDRWHGATVHFVTDELDGGPAVVQYRLPVLPGDTESSLAQRVHKGEHLILPRAVAWFAAGRLRLARGSVMLDGRALEAPVSVDEGGALE
jgi:hypothetical protein